jgi:hypothetical protein
VAIAAAPNRKLKEAYGLLKKMRSSSHTSPTMDLEAGVLSLNLLVNIASTLSLSLSLSLSHIHMYNLSGIGIAVGLHRCGKSCRLRWINYLRPDLKRGTFTQEEEQIIIDVHRIVGNK